MSVIAKGSYFWRSAAQGMRHAPFVHVIAVTTLAIALFAGGLARGGARLVDGLVRSIGGEVELTVYLAEGATPEAAAELAKALSSRTGGEATAVSPDLALGRLAAELGERGAALEGLTDNPLPWTVELKLLPAAGADSAAGATSARELARELRSLPTVSDVDYGEEAVQRLTAIARALRLGGLGAFALVALATAVIVSATLQLAIYARRAEIEIQKLVGATDQFVKVPFLIEGVMQGVLGALLAMAGLLAFAALAGPRLGELFGFLSVPTEVALLDFRLGAELLAVGAALGLFGSLLAVRRFLRV